MVNRDIIPKIKQATVAVGLVRKGTFQMVSVNGSGFMIDKNGIILTAKHVVDGLRYLQEHHNRANKIETNIAIFRPIHNSTEFNFDTGVIDQFRNITHSKKGEHFPLFDIDLAFCKLAKPFPDFNPLEIKFPEHLKTLQEVAVCGYPSGEHSLDIQGKNIGVRFSPILQLGRIGGLLPFDDAPNPYGIQTDIIGVGGSSGSPLVDPNDGSVIGIAQKVLPAGVSVEVKDHETGKNMKGFGTAIIGQIYGLTNHILHPVTNAVRRYFAGERIDEFQINATGLDFHYHLVGTK
ncbi:MAG: serine protease [Nitrosopumilaceae archaeon]